MRLSRYWGMWSTRGAGSQVSYTPKYIFIPVCIHAESFL